MRRMLVVSLLAAIAALSGCASVPGVTPFANVDIARVARVESAARSMGVQVYWLNYPTKSVAQVN